MGTFVQGTEFVTESCCHDGCGVLFAFTRDYYREVRNDRNRWWYCPNGHRQHYTSDSAEEKLRQAEVRETALRDQLEASAREAEHVRGVLLRDRHRFANGVCPCCNRSFENVRRHMETKHPDYDTTVVDQPSTVRFPCGCGRSFESLRGLRIHQGSQRRDDWYKPSAPQWKAHLTKV